MSHVLIKETVDIDELPKVDERYLSAPGKQITIGDLHGNAIKLLFLLVMHGIAKNLSDSDYNELVTIYKTRPLQTENKNQFNSLLNKIKFNKDTLIRFIGDELADRGCNDYFTLKLLEKLYINKVPVEILLSNHSVEFIEAYERSEDFYPAMLSNSHTSSMVELQKLIETGVVTREEIIKLTHSYKPTLKLISYSLDIASNTITLYSHAAMGINTIKDAAKQLDVLYSDLNAIALAQTIERINKKYQSLVQSNKVHTLYNSYAMNAGYSGYYDLTETPIVLLMWNRLYEENIIERPEQLNGFNLCYVHGHDSGNDQKASKNSKYFNLDNSLGKLPEDKYNRGEYSALYSSETPLTKLIQEGIAQKSQPTSSTILAPSFLPLNKKITDTLNAAVKNPSSVGLNINFFQPDTSEIEVQPDFIPSNII